jgi:hypothetical protein
VVLSDEGLSCAFNWIGSVQEPVGASCCDWRDVIVSVKFIELLLVATVELTSCMIT